MCKTGTWQESNIHHRLTIDVKNGPKTWIYSHTRAVEMWSITAIAQAGMRKSDLQSILSRPIIGYVIYFAAVNQVKSKNLRTCHACTSELKIVCLPLSVSPPVCLSLPLCPCLSKYLETLLLYSLFTGKLGNSVKQDNLAWRLINPGVDYLFRNAFLKYQRSSERHKTFRQRNKFKAFVWLSMLHITVSRS